MTLENQAKSSAAAESGPRPAPATGRATSTLRSFGVEYHHLHTREGGDLYVTDLGLPFLKSLLPEQWYEDMYYACEGIRLPGATGTVYRVRTKPVDGKQMDVVVKFSRVGQEVPLEIATTFPDHVMPAEIANARFNSPFEEFGLVMELRDRDHQTEGPNLIAQRPLAIFAPLEEFALWRLGRSHGRFLHHQKQLEVDQQHLENQQAIELDIRREYVVLYSWLHGENAEDVYVYGGLTEDQFAALTPRVIHELKARGFRVLDNKPKHFILRPRRQGQGVLTRQGKITYGLVDFELLQRTRDSIQLFKKQQRSRYLRLMMHQQRTPPETWPGHLRPMQILGQDYVFGAAPNGGLIWALGQNPELFEYFLPDRWRRTPRIKLSPAREVCRTRTRDNIHMIYRLSRVGERPHVDPFYESDRRLREAGYNSPFEEVAICERLRQAGIATVHPRAIYRTGHESAKTATLPDSRRYQMFSGLFTPAIEGEADPQPILSPGYDYFIIWGFWRGIDPLADYSEAGHWGYVDVAQAHESNLLSDQQYEAALDSVQLRLEQSSLADQSIDSSSLLLSFRADGQSFRTDDADRLQLTLAVNAVVALDAGILSTTEYHGLIERQIERLHEAGFEPLALKGYHLSLTTDPDGNLKRDATGEVQATLNNEAFESIRMKFSQLK